LERSDFEKLVEQAFDRLPPKFKEAVENVGIVVEDYPSEEIVRNMRLRSKRQLFGLYQGVPLPHRGTWYGMSPVSPDKISLYQKNIEAFCRDDTQIEQLVYDVLVHEIGHYFGMNDEEIRDAGY
jgi:predicted Zn-dependent protease with MMP-like domain